MDAGAGLVAADAKQVATGANVGAELVPTFGAELGDLLVLHTLVGRHVVVLVISYPFFPFVFCFSAFSFYRLNCWRKQTFLSGFFNPEIWK